MCPITFSSWHGEYFYQHVLLRWFSASDKHQTTNYRLSVYDRTVSGRLGPVFLIVQFHHEFDE